MSEFGRPKNPGERKRGLPGSFRRLIPGLRSEKDRSITPGDNKHGSEGSNLRNISTGTGEFPTGNVQGEREKGDTADIVILHGLGIGSGSESASSASTEKLSNLEILTKVSGHVNRIFAASRDSLVKTRDEVQIDLSLMNKIVSLTRNKRGHLLFVSISEPITEGNSIADADNYMLGGDMYVKHHTTTVQGNEWQSTRNAIADAEQKHYLLAVLESLTDEKIIAELTAREAFRGNIDRIIASQGQQVEDHQEASISREGFEILIFKHIVKVRGEKGYPFFSIAIENKADANGSDKVVDIKKQIFTLAGDSPLTVETQRYGDTTEKGITTVADEDQTTYVIILLEELA